MRGAGGTRGGVGQFIIGFVMLAAGGFLFLDSISVINKFSLGHSLYSYSGFNLTGGMVLIPLIFGIGMVFYNSKNPLGWLLCLGGFIALSFGVIASLDFKFRSMTAFDLLTILVLFVGGIGLFLSSLKEDIKI